MRNILLNILSDDKSLKYLSFREFCSLKDKGLRKQSFVVLQTFLNETKQWTTEEQHEFIIWLFELIEVSDNFHHVLVHLLEEQFIKPIFKTWMDSNNDSRPYRWFGMFLNTEHRLVYLEKAIELGGCSEQNALNKVIDLKFYSLWFSFHHISENTYLGEINEDRQLLKEIQDLMENVQDENIKALIKEDLEYYNNLINDWEEFNIAKHDNFVEWCIERNRNYDWVKSYYYE